MLVVGIPALAGGSEAVSTYNLTQFDFDPQFAFQTVAVGETNHTATQMLEFNPETTFFDATMEFQGIEAFQNVTLWGSARNENFGHAVDTRGDFNGDGIPDLAVSAPGAYRTTGGLSRVEVFYGRGNGTFPAAADLILYGDNGTAFGSGLAHGDFNSDGFDDLAVSDSDDFADRIPVPPTVRVFFGSSAGLPVTFGLELTGPVGAGWGAALAGGLDLDGDGYDDLVVNAPDYFDYRPLGCPGFANCSWAHGQLTVFWGGAAGLSWGAASAIEAWNLSRFGEVLEALGDADGNGADEIATGALYPADGRAFAAVYTASSSDRSFQVLWNTRGPSLADYFGYSFAGGTDVTGDDVPDLVVGAPYAGGWGGAAYIFAGNGTGGYSAEVTGIVTSVAPWAGAYYGYAVEFVGDIDGDGVEDLAVSQPYDAGSRLRIFLYPVNNISNATAPRLWGHTYSGWILAALGDINGDGMADMLEAGEIRHTGIFYAGGVTVYFGSLGSSPANFTLHVGNTSVLAVSGPLKGPIRALNFSAQLKAYLVAHTDEAQPNGRVSVPLTTEFSQGGLLRVVWLTLSFSEVPVPYGLKVFPVDHRPAIYLAWSAHQSVDADEFLIWTNRSGSWTQIAVAARADRQWGHENLQVGESVCYRIIARDSVARIESAPSEEACGVVFNPYPPAPPGQVTAQADATGAAIEVRWAPVLLNVGSFEVWREDGAAGGPFLVGTVDASTFLFTDSAVAEDEVYTYRLRSISPQALASGLSAPATASLPDLTPPGAPEGVHARAEDGGHSALVQWVSNDRDAVQFVVVYAYRDDPATLFEVGPAATQLMRLEGLRAGVDLLVIVIAIDEEGRRSAESIAASIPLIDLVFPAPPDEVHAVPTPEGGALFVSWMPSRHLDVVAYRVYVLDPDAAPVPVVRGEMPSETLSFVLAGLRNRFFYSVYVSSIDSAGHESALSEAAIAAPERQRPPNVPEIDSLPLLTHISPLDVEGSCEPHLWVELHLDGQLAAVAECSADGRFASHLTLKEGTSLLTARGVDAAPFVRVEWRESAFTPTIACTLDQTAPKVVWSNPAPSENDARPEGAIEIGLSEAVNESANSLVVRGEDFQPISGEVSYDRARQVLVFHPTEPLRPAGRYSVEVKARDAAGNNLQLYAFSFRVAPEAPPTPVVEETFPVGTAVAAALAMAAALTVVALFLARKRRGRGLP